MRHNAIKMFKEKRLRIVSKIIGITALFGVTLSIFSTLLFQNLGFTSNELLLNELLWAVFYAILTFLGFKFYKKALQIFSFYGFYALFHFFQNISALPTQQSASFNLMLGKLAINSFYISTATLSIDLILGICLMYFFAKLVHDTSQNFKKTG